MRVELEETGATNKVTYSFQIFPEATGIRISVAQYGSTARPDYTNETLEAIERIQTGLPHLKFTQVILRDRTDNRNELAFEQEWRLQPNEARLDL